MSGLLLATALAVVGVQSAGAGTRDGHDPSGAGRTPHHVSWSSDHGRSSDDHTTNTTTSTDPTRVGESHRDRARTDRRVSARDRWFLVASARIGLAEVAEGKLAESRSTDAGVQKFAQQMIDDHTAQLITQSALHDQLGVPVPTSPSARQQAQAAELAQLSGPDFDQAYLAAQVHGHREAIALFVSEVRHGSNRTVRSFARKSLPTLFEHLKMAKSLLESISSASSTPSATAA